MGTDTPSKPQRSVNIGPLKRQMPMREAYFSQKECVPLTQCPGRIAAEALGIYPPGICAIFPGEVYTKSLVQYLLNMKQAGAELFGQPAVIKNRVEK